MRKVSTVLSGNNGCSCAPCYPLERCGESAAFPLAIPVKWETSEAQNFNQENYLGGPDVVLNNFGYGSSCISFQDAKNKAIYEALRKILMTVITPVWEDWTADKSNFEMSATAYCPCGWIGDPVTVTEPANTFNNYWSIAEANYQASVQAESEAISSLICTPPL